MEETKLGRFYDLQRMTRELKGYGFKFNDCLPERRIAAFEKKFKLRLPEEYRAYLKLIGNGGAGPADSSCFDQGNYYSSDFFYIYPLDKTNPLRQDHWHYDKRTSFRKLRKPFPYKEDNTHNQEICNKLWSRLPKKDNSYQGLLVLSHQGCGACLVMEVTGEKPGRVWFAEFSRGIGIRLVRDSFYEWFNNWARASLEFQKLERGIYSPDFSLTDPQTYLELGIVYLRKNMYEEAIDRFKKVLELDPKNKKACYYWGQVYLEQDLPEQAIEMFKKQISLDPDDPESYFVLGNAYLDLDKNFEAIEQYDKAISLKADASSYYNNRGLARKANGMLKQAESDFLMAITVNPNYAATSYYNMAYILKDKGNLEQAIEYLKKYISIKENNWYKVYRLENEYLEKGMYDQAIEELSQAISGQPVFIEAYYYTLGVTYGHKGMIDKEIEMYLKAISISPDYAVNAYFSLGEAYQRKNLLEEAFEIYETVSSIDKNDIYNYFYVEKGHLNKISV